MRVPQLLPFVTIALAGCASKAGPSQAPVPDAASAGGPHHHCEARPAAPDPFEVAIAIPYQDDVRDRIAPDERAAFEAAVPTFVRYCVHCHATGTKKVKASTLERLDMTSYPFASADGDAIAETIRIVVGASGGAPSMPLFGRDCLEPAELGAIRAWADAFDRAHTNPSTP